MIAENERKLEEQIAKLKKELSQARKENAASTAVSPYTFKTNDEDVELIDLFGSQQDLLVIHNMGEKCAYCTAYADGVNGVLHHLEQRTSVVLLSNSLPETQRSFAQDRGWKFRLVSAAGTSFSKDMGFEPSSKEFWPGVIGFRKDGDSVRLISKTYFDPGDDMCAIWPLMSFLEEGDNDWRPTLQANHTGLKC